MELPANHPKRQQLEDMRQFAFESIDSWNEDEYKFFFISPLISLVDFSTPNYKPFTQRPMSVKYDNDKKITEGLVEFMLAKGIQTPKKPHFFCTNTNPKNAATTTHLGNC